MGAEAFSWAGRTAQAVSPTDVPENHQLRHALGQFGDTAEEANWWEKYDFDQDVEENRQREEERKAEGGRSPLNTNSVLVSRDA